jgi:hypothetical protein
MFHLNEDASPGMCRPEDIEKLAALVAKQVRDDYSNKHANLWIKRIDDAVKAEREACAKVCLEQSARWHNDQRDVYVAHECAAAIRARSEK